MSRISSRLGLSKIYSNHSVRATTATRLAEAGVETRDIMKVTGHKNPMSVQTYNSEISDEQNRNFNNILRSSTDPSNSMTSGSGDQTSSPTQVLEFSQTQNIINTEFSANMRVPVLLSHCSNITININKK